MRGSADLYRCLIPQAYQTQMKVNALKKADLLKLCKYIPNDNVHFMIIFAHIIELLYERSKPVQKYLFVHAF